MKIVDVRNKLPRHPVKRYLTRELTSITHVVLHHSGTREGSPMSFAKYHVFLRGWPGIGYHYVINKDGTIYKTNSLSTISYHTRGLNRESVGICLIGNFSVEIPRSAELASLFYLLGLFWKYFPHWEVIFHRDAVGSRTVCPGHLFPENWYQLGKHYFNKLKVEDQDA